MQDTEQSLACSLLSESGTGRIGNNHCNGSCKVFPVLSKKGKGRTQGWKEQEDSRTDGLSDTLVRPYCHWKGSVWPSHSQGPMLQSPERFRAGQADLSSWGDLEELGAG